MPFPTSRLANVALHTLAVDEELSPLVRRSFALDVQQDGECPQAALDSSLHVRVSGDEGESLRLGPEQMHDREERADSKDVGSLQRNVLVTEYRATTDRMLRVSVNGFFESLAVIISSMRELDEDVVGDAWQGDGDTEVDSLTKVQGLQEAGVI